MRRSGCRGLPRVDCRAPRGLRLFSAPHKHDAQASGLRDRDRHVAALPVGSGDDVGRKSRHEQLALKGHNMSAQTSELFSQVVGRFFHVISLIIFRWMRSA
jgi:hypothetical protein